MNTDEAQAQSPGTGARFLLFVAATAPSALRALRNLEHGLHHNGLASNVMEVVDVFREPERALEWRVFATPTLVRRSAPEERLYGDLADTGVLARFLLRGA